LGKFNSVPEMESLNGDFLTGLDTWIGEEDKKLM